MAKFEILVASTSVTVNVFIRDSSSATGAGLTGLAFNTASLTAYYALPRAAAVAITLATLAAVTSAYSSGGFKEIDATNMPGWYRLDIPNAALASGRFVDIQLQGAANMAQTPIEIELTAVDNQDAVRMGLTSIPNVVQGNAGQLPTANSSGQVVLSSVGLDQVVMSDIAAVPSMTGTLKAAINWMYAIMRNKRTQTATTETLYKTDDATAVATSAKSDDATTFTRSRYS